MGGAFNRQIATVPLSTLAAIALLAAACLLPSEPIPAQEAGKDDHHPDGDRR
jgi:hypothetical protein